MIKLIQARIRSSIEVKQATLDDKFLLGQVADLAQRCLKCLQNGGKVIFAGNGGSFADAQHLSAEFTSRFQFDRPPLRSLALGTNSSAMSAIGNDYGYDQVFSRELQGIAQSSDVFIAISTSGNSQNILSAVDKAIELGIYVSTWTGQTGGKLASSCDCECLKIPSTDTARIQENHIMLGHVLCDLVERKCFK